MSQEAPLNPSEEGGYGTVPFVETDLTPQRAGKRLAVASVQGAGYALSLLLLLVLTFLVLRIPPREGLTQIWTGAFGSASDGHLYPLSETLVETAPLLLTSLSVVVAWRAGLFSIGAQGQLMMGGLTATLLAHFCPRLPAPLLTILMVVVATAGGALWGWVAGWLRIRRNVHEVISTIMLNYVAHYLISWQILGALRAQGDYLTESNPLPNSVLFAHLIPAAWSDHIQTSLHSGVLIALLGVPLVQVYLFHTRPGFQMQVLGNNAEAARVGRFPTDKLRLQAMLLSGGLCGLAGAIELLGSATGSLPAENFGGTVGFTAIPVALLGGLHPIGTLFSALFFGALTQGCRNLEQNTGVSSVLIYVIQAIAVLGVVGIRAWRERRQGTVA